MDGLKFEAQRAAMEARATRGPGRLPVAEREALAAGAAGSGPLAAFGGKLEQRSFRVTDEDFEELRAAGFTDPQLFEVCVTASLGAAARRYTAGLAAFDASTAEGE
jgi:hypothetical protein